MVSLLDRYIANRVAVSTLLDDRALAARMGAAGRARVERAHAWPAIAERLVVWLQAAVG